MNEVVHTSPTIGSNVEEITWKNIHFVMWDIGKNGLRRGSFLHSGFAFNAHFLFLGGQESLRQSWSTYYGNTDFVILVVDSSDRDRLSVTKEEFYRMLAHDVSWPAIFT